MFCKIDSRLVSLPASHTRNARNGFKRNFPANSQQACKKQDQIISQIYHLRATQLRLFNSVFAKRKPDEFPPFCVNRHAALKCNI